ncbi:MAG: dihydrolipoamide acetyltransferase family protein [Isosphaeraceae bacterium]|nr:dihydrolipoamide acetyltransferase family protein [Isosphaeraceae bacterium]
MPIEVTMPKLSPTMESGKIAQWMVKVGDQVKEGDVLADVETDKATMAMSAYDEGVVAHLDFTVGEEVGLGQRVLVLAKKGEDPKKVAEALGASKAPVKSDQAKAGTPGKPEAQGAGSNGKEAGAHPAEAAHVGSGGRARSTPLARKIAAESKVDIATIPGSGPGGRVIRSDVESFLEKRTKTPAAPSPAPRPAAAAAQRIPHSNMRKTIAKRMTQAKQEAPEIHVTVDVRVDQVVAVRERLNKQLAAEKVKLSLGDFVTKAVALALRKHPGVNASFEPDAIVLQGAVNVGIAVALPNSGLIVPVLKNADTLGLKEIRVQSEQLASAARENKLTGDQLADGTFTISNLGMYGVRQFDAIINLPQVAILAVGAAEKRPVVENDALTVGTVLTLTITADHRAVDGALAAEFLRTVKGLLEEPASMLL